MFAEKSIVAVAAHIEAVIRALAVKPVVVGHSFGGLLAQILAGRGLAAATVAESLDRAPNGGLRPLRGHSVRLGSWDQ